MRKVWFWKLKCSAHTNRKTHKSILFPLCSVLFFVLCLSFSLSLSSCQKGSENQTLGQSVVNRWCNNEIYRTYPKALKKPNPTSFSTYKIEWIWKTMYLQMHPMRTVNSHRHCCCFFFTQWNRPLFNADGVTIKSLTTI